MDCLLSALKIRWDSQQIVRLTVAVVSLDHCVQGPAELRSVGRWTLIQHKELSGPRNWLIIVFSLPRSYQVDRTSR
jgi:hypothetical protein